MNRWQHQVWQFCLWFCLNKVHPSVLIPVFMTGWGKGPHRQYRTFTGARPTPTALSCAWPNLTLNIPWLWSVQPPRNNSLPTSESSHIEVSFYNIAWLNSLYVDRCFFWRHFVSACIVKILLDFTNLLLKITSLWTSLAIRWRMCGRGFSTQYMALRLSRVPCCLTSLTFC